MGDKSELTGKAKDMNIIIILVDGARSDHLGKFKNFDNVVNQGSLFPNEITYAPYTFATTHAFVTGMYGTENGMDSYYGVKKFKADECKTLQEYLHDDGYHTVGDLLSPFDFPKKGFDDYRVFDEQKDDLLKRHTALVKEMSELSKDGKKFYLFLHYASIHTEWVRNVAKKFDDFSEEYFGNKEKFVKLYNSYFSIAADYLKTMFEELKASNLLDNSVVIVFSDHGASNADRIGEKAYGSFCYDYTIKAFVSFINKELFPAEKIDKQIRCIDVMPTLLDLLEIKPDKSFKPMQGKSLLPTIGGKKQEEWPAFSETAPLGGPNPSPSKPNFHSIRFNGWKLIFAAAPKKFELYNLKEDPEEKNNLESTNPKKKKELLKLLLEFKPELEQDFP